jgi:hypothetical protein
MIIEALLVAALLQAPPLKAPEADAPSAAMREIEASFARSDKAALIAAFDMEAFNKRIYAGLSPTENDRQSSVRTPDQLGTGIASLTKQGASYRFLRIRSVGGQKRALFRLVMTNGAFNYHELLLGERGGKVRVDDLYVALSGEWISQSLRRAWQLGEAVGNPGLLARLTGADAELVKSAALVKEYGDHVAAGRKAEALVTYEKLPPTVRDSKNFLIGALTQAGDDAKAYSRLVERFQKLFPNDAALDILLIDYCFNRKEYARLLQAIDSLDRSLGGDAYLRNLKAGIQTLTGDATGARQSLHEAIAMEPSLENPYWSLIEIQLGAKEWSPIVDTLVAIERDASVKLGDLKGIPLYADFIKTREYRDWIKKHPR